MKPRIKFYNDGTPVPKQWIPLDPNIEEVPYYYYDCFKYHAIITLVSVVILVLALIHFCITELP